MSRMDKIKALGKAVSDGKKTRDEAISELVAESSGGLTEFGAADAIDNWDTADKPYGESRSFRSGRKKGK